MEHEDLEEIIDTLREQALGLQAQYERHAYAAAAQWDQDRPELLDTISALSETRDIKRAEVKRAREALSASQAAAAQPIGAGVTSGFNVIQSRAGQDGQPLPTESLMAERDRLVEALGTLDEQIDAARRELQLLARTEEQELCESRLIILQDTRRMYQDEVDMMEIELLGRERAERMAAERAAAEANGRAELARMEADLLATEQKLDISKKRLYFPAAKGYGMSFGSNGIYVGGKDTFISELTGNWDVKGAVFPQGVLGNLGPVPRVTVLLGASVAPTVQRASGTASLRNSGSFKSAQQAASHIRRTSSSMPPSPVPPSPQRPATASGRQAEPSAEQGPALQSRPSNGQPAESVMRSPLGAPAPAKDLSNAEGGVLGLASRFEAGAAASSQTDSIPDPAALNQDDFAEEQSADRRMSNGGAGPSGMDAAGRQPIMGLPPRDPRSKSKNLAMKMINKIGNKKEFKKPTEAPKYPGVEMEKGRSLASRLLSKKASKRSDKLQFGSNAQGSQRRHSALPTFSTDVPAALAPPQETASPLPAFAPQANGSSQRLAAAAEDVGIPDAEPPSARASEDGQSMLDPDGTWPDDDPSTGDGPPLERASTGADSWDGISTAGAANDGLSSLGGTSDRGSDGMTSTMASSRRGMFAALRIEDLGVIGEKGTKVPNVTVAEINIELEFQMTFVFEYDSSANAWITPRKPKMEILHLDRTVRGNNVPLPRTLLRFVLNATLPRIIQRRILRGLPPELGRYLLDAGRNFSSYGEIGIVGPALSALDAHIAFSLGSITRAKDAKRSAQHAAAAQESRSMLGLTLEQASALAELFGGPLSLLGKQRRACIADLIAFFAQRSADAQLWPQLCTVWDAALRAVCQAREVRDMPPFARLMEIAVAGLGRKPVRARFQMHKLEAAVNVDALLGAARDYFERVTREYHEKGPGGAPRQPRDVEAAQSLEVQLAALAAWETYVFGRLKTFKSRFKKLSCTAVGGAEAERFSVGAEEVSYEGPLQLRLQVPTPIVEGDGAFSFFIPLPNPKGPIRAFLDRVRSVLTMPLPPYFAPHLNSLVSGGEGVEGEAADEGSEQPQEKSVLQALQDLHTHLGTDSPPSSAASAAGGDEAEPSRQRIGKMIVNRMRVRVRLNEVRLGEMLRGMDPASLGDSFVSVTAGLLACIGDIACLNFMPVFSEDGAKGQYLLCLESSDVSNISADLQALGFQSAINPGRMIRVLHALVRTVLITLRPEEKERLAAVDQLFESVYRYTVRDALDLSLALNVQGRVEDNPNLPGLKQIYLHLAGTSDSDVPPISLTNDIDLVTLYRALSSSPSQ